MEIDFGFGPQELVISVWTLTIYEQEFKADMIADYFGDQTVRKSDLIVDDSDVLYTIKFSDSRLTKAMQVLWACLKAVDDNLPSYKEWAKGMVGINLLDINSQLQELVGESLFRARVADSGKTAE